MKKIAQFMWVLILFNTCSSISGDKSEKESFEGVITYKLTVNSKLPDLKTEYLQSSFGDEVKEYIKNGNMKFVYNGYGFKFSCYLSKTNIEYSVRNKIDTIFTIDCSKNEPELLDIEMLKSKETIAGRQCNGLFMDCSETKDSIYYDSTIYINPKYFEKHKIAHYDEYFRIAKAPWLKYVFVGKAFIKTTEAIKIERLKLDDSIFDLPDFPHKELKY